MTISYIILAHKNPEQVKRLVQKLSHKDCYFYIHVDKKTDISPFLEKFSQIKNVFFMPDNDRELLIWGDFSIVQATLTVMRKIITDERTGYVVLLSGQDYPIKSNTHIQSFFTKNRGKEFIDCHSMPDQIWQEEGLRRLTKYKCALSEKRYHNVSCPSLFEASFYTRDNFRNICRCIKYRKWGFLLKLFKKRRIPNYIKSYGWSQWWALSLETVQKIISYIEKRPEYFTYHKDSSCPDEIFFQSIVINMYKDNMAAICEDIHHIDWHRRGIYSPLTFTSWDINILKNQPAHKLFARKFDSDIDAAILDALDTL